MDCDKLKQMSEITIDAFFTDLWEQDKLNFKEDLEKSTRQAKFQRGTIW